MHLEEPIKHTRLFGKNTQNCANYEAYTRVKYLERKQEEATFCSLTWWWCLPCGSVNCAYHRLQYKYHLKSFSSPFVFHSLSHLSDSKHTAKEINSCPYGFNTCCWLTMSLKSLVGHLMTLNICICHHQWLH